MVRDNTPSFPSFLLSKSAPTGLSAGHQNFNLTDQQLFFLVTNVYKYVENLLLSWFHYFYSLPLKPG